MASYSYPSIKTIEIDNTIRDNAENTEIGVGAIVIKSNKGPVNQRVLVNDYSQFKKIYGAPENLDDYGHFAAKNFLNNSNNLLVVRATMGDEGYAQIQYPYEDADMKDVNTSNDVCEFRYTDNEDVDQLVLVKAMTAADIVNSLSSEYKTNGLSGFVFSKEASVATIDDLTNSNTPNQLVFKNKGTNSDADLFDAEGYNVNFVSKVNVDKEPGSVIKTSNILLTSAAWNYTGTNPQIAANSFYIKDFDNEDVKKVSFYVPASDTLNNEGATYSMYLNTSACSGYTENGASYSAIFNNDNFWTGSVTEANDYCTTAEAAKVSLLDWDDCVNKTFYVDKEKFDDSLENVVGISYREYGMNTFKEALSINTSEYPKIEQFDIMLSNDRENATKYLNNLAVELGTSFGELASSKYGRLTYKTPWSNPEDDEDVVEVIVYTEGLNLEQTDLFYYYQEKDSTKPKAISVYKAEEPSQIVIPWTNDGTTKNINGETLDKMVAHTTSELLNATNEKYKDGFTNYIETDEDPGNGDIEEYMSNFDNQLVIAAKNPGKWGNDIGISIITPECEHIAALNGKAPAFDWKYNYDDEDQVDADDENIDYIYKKVYRINVYVKSPSQTTEAAWGTGLDALLKDPVEFFYVSNDPTAKTEDGESLYAPNVINKQSNYIYVSRSSVKNAVKGDGTYALPKQTFAIYPLNGGSNSKKNTIAEKTAALKLYEDKEKANLDILFNVETIDSFSNKQRYATMQRRIAEIASKREKDIGVIQVTSTSAKSIKSMVGEAKMFTFDKGTYVACYSGYDKYFDTDLGAYIYLPKSVAAACAMALCDTQFYTWQAPAGTDRGIITYNKGQLNTLTAEEFAELYSNHVNTSRQIGLWGEILMGNKTALKKDSELNRINVRRCLNFIEKRLELLMTPYLFQNNVESTRTSARATINSFLSRIQAADGLVSYSAAVYADPNDNHVLIVELHVIPPTCIEFIKIVVNVDKETNSITVSEA